MSARDDYPTIAKLMTTEDEDALDEIDRLRAEVARLTPVVEAAKRLHAGWRGRGSDGPDEVYAAEDDLDAAVSALKTTVPGDTNDERPEDQ